MTDNPQAARTKVVLKPNGPCVIFGPMEITYPDGSVEVRDRNASICTCGLSEELPFCDGSHKAAAR